MILLTGATGFIGKHLLAQLISKYGKDKIVVLSSRPIDNCNYLLHKNYQFDEDYFVNSNCSEIGTIIHAGAFTPKTASEANNIPGSTSNIINTTKLIKANLPNLKKFIFLSTLDVYGPAAIINEDTIEAPQSLYGESKLYCEKLINVWGESSAVHCQILRIGHVYGPGEEAYQKIIPLTIQKILAGEALDVYGKGEAIRSFIYIEDVVKAILNATEINKKLGAINIVGEEQVKIIDLIKKLIKLSQKDVKLNYIKSDSNSRDMVFDNSLLRRHLGNPVTMLSEGLQLEWEYMKKVHNANIF